jgi:hypothetical protein
MTTPRARHRRPALAALTCVLAMTGATVVACGSGDGEARASASSVDAHAKGHHTMAHTDDARIALYSTMRSLWGQHMEWTYATVVAFATDAPYLQPTLDRLLKNQSDIGDAVATYYGTAAGDRLTGLLTSHIEEAVPVLAAAKAGDKPALGKAVTAWYANARDIADFLASANPSWKRAEMRQMMKEHITQTIAYAGDVIGGDFDAAIRDYGLAEAHMFEMADVLSRGITDQFPNRF